MYVCVLTGRSYVFDIRRTAREAEDFARRELFKQAARAPGTTATCTSPLALTSGAPPASSATNAPIVTNATNVTNVTNAVLGAPLDAGATQPSSHEFEVCLPPPFDSHSTLLIHICCIHKIYSLDVSTT